jgi:hypothetical protein
MQTLGTITINSGAASTNSRGVTLTLSCSYAQGCSWMKFSNDNVTYSTPVAYDATKAWTLTTGDGPKTVYVKFKDTLGNWSSAYSDTILLDQTPPITTASPPQGSYSPPQSITLTCNDSNGVGCETIYYTTNGSTPSTSSPVYSTSVNISATTTLKFFAKDLAGNSESVKTQIYTILPPSWTSTPGVTPSSPALAWDSVFRKLHLAVRGAADTLWGASYDSSGIFNNDWTQLPTGTTETAPSISWNPTHSKLYIAARGSDSRTYIASVNSSMGAFSGWTAHPSGSTPSAPAVAWNMATNMLHIAVRGASNFIYISTLNLATGAFSSWTQLSNGTTPDSPAIAINTVASEVYVVVRGMDNSLWEWSVPY